MPSLLLKTDVFVNVNASHKICVFKINVVLCMCTPTRYAVMMEMRAPCEKQNAPCSLLLYYTQTFSENTLHFFFIFKHLKILSSVHMNKYTCTYLIPTTQSNQHKLE